MERKAANFKLSEVTEAGTFIGHAAVFGNIDLGGDVITKGAFRKTINDNGGKFPLLDDHDDTVGIVEASEDQYGLLVKGVINLETDDGQSLYSNIKFMKANGIDPGMSIGYLPIPGKIALKTDHRELSEVKLLEVTVTPIPMNELARVTQVKSVEDARLAEFEKRITALEQKATEAAPAAPAQPEPVQDHSAELALARLRLLLN